jgi:UDP-perosamine 4-acetyltransferase
MKTIILSAGGHAAVLAAMLRENGARVAGFTDPSAVLRGRIIEGAKVLGGDDQLDGVKPAGVRLVNGMGAAKDTLARRRLYRTFRALGFRFPAVASKTAHVSRSAIIAEGAQVLTRAVIHPRARIGENAVINTCAIVEHDAIVGAHAFVSPGAILLGGACVGEGALIGALAVILPGVKVGAGARVGAGATVTRNVPAGITVTGTPARSVK